MERACERFNKVSLAHLNFPSMFLDRAIKLRVHVAVFRALVCRFILASHKVEQGGQLKDWVCSTRVASWVCSTELASKVEKKYAEEKRAEEQKKEEKSWGRVVLLGLSFATFGFIGHGTFILLKSKAPSKWLLEIRNARRTWHSGSMTS